MALSLQLRKMAWGLLLAQFMTVTGVAAPVRVTEPVTLNADSREMEFLESKAVGEKGIVRIGGTRIRWDDLRNAPTDTGTILHFDLFADVSLTGAIERLNRRGNESFTCFGPLTGPLKGSFMLSVQNNAMDGQFQLDDGRVFSLSYATEALHEATEIAAGEAFTCGLNNAVVPPEPAGAFEPASGTPADDDASQIDVLIVYTPSALMKAGSLAAMQAKINLIEDYTNQAYANSLITTSVRIVHSAEIAYAESNQLFGSLLDLTNTSSTDNYLNEVQAMRDAYGADLIVLLQAAKQPDSAGVAWLLTSLVTPSFYSGASVTEYSNSSPRTFAHEVGHNQGCHHDRANSFSQGLFPYSYGLYLHDLDASNFYGTIMSYRGSVTPHFSNPDVLLAGTPTGVAIDQPNSAHNALTINSSAGTVANYRQTITPTISLTPGENLFFSGPQGGTFTSEWANVDIENTSGESVTWTAVAESIRLPNPQSPGSYLFYSPLSVSVAGDDLDSGEIDTIAVVPNAQIQSLPAGLHNCTIRIVDQTHQVTRIVLALIEVRPVDHYGLSAIGAEQTASIPFNLTISALDRLNEVVAGHSGNVNISAFRNAAIQVVDQQVGVAQYTSNQWINAWNDVGRHQLIYSAQELNLGATYIHGLSLHFAEAPDATFTPFNIRIKPTLLNDFGVVGYRASAWETNDWALVYQQNCQINTTGWVRFDFNQPYYYDGTSNLMIDLSQTYSGTWLFKGAISLFNKPGYLSYAMSEIDITNDDPLLWNGSDPHSNHNSDRPVLKLHVDNLTAVATIPSIIQVPGGGTWSGTVTIQEAGPDMILAVDDSAGRTGISPFFDVVPLSRLVVWVDSLWNGLQSGTQAQPFVLIQDGISNVDSGGTIRLQAGNYSFEGRVTKPLRMEALGGSARIE